MATKDSPTRVSMFHWWMGNDEFLLWEWQYVYAEDIDIYRDPRFVQLAPKPVEYDTALEDFVVLVYFYANQDNWVFYFYDSKFIKKKNWTIVYLDSTRAKEFFWPWRMVKAFEQGLFFADNKVQIISLFVTTGTYAGWEVTTGGIWQAAELFNSAIGDADVHPFIEQGSLVYMAWDDVERIEYNWPDWVSGLPDYTTTPLSVNWNGGFSDIQLQSDTIWASSTLLNLTKTLLSSFDASGNVGQIKPLNQQVVQGYNRDGQLFIVTGSMSSQTNIDPATAVEYDCIQMYANYWFGANWQQLITRSRISDWVTKGFANNSNWLVFYFLWEFGVTNHNWFSSNWITYTIQSKDDEACIYAYWKAIGATRDAFTVIVSKTSAWKRIKRIWGLFQNTTATDAPVENFYFTYEDEDGNFGIDRFYNYMGIENPPEYQPSGKILLRVDDGGDYGMVKEIKWNVTVGCDVPTGTTIVISYVLDDGNETEYATITPTTKNSNIVKEIKLSKPIRGFQTIAWYIKLTGWTNTPKLYNFNYELGAIQ